MSEEQKLYEEIGQSRKETEQSQLFGKPCFKINGQAFVCLFQNEMVFKLTGDIHSRALSLVCSQLFDPSGKKRPMKAWVQVSFEHKSRWPELAMEALVFVSPEK